MVWRWKYYESDATKLMREVLSENPRITDEQKKGRAIWWDKTIDLDAMRRLEESRVKQQAYVYQTKD